MSADPSSSMVARLQSLPTAAQLMQVGDSSVPTNAAAQDPDREQLVRVSTDLSPDETMEIAESVLNEVVAQGRSQAQSSTEPTSSQADQEFSPDLAQIWQAAAVESQQSQSNSMSHSQGGMTKEHAVPGTTAGAAELGITSPDVGVSTAVEYEPQPEISPEVESFIQRVEEQEDQLPQEIAVSGDTISMQNTQYAAQPVIVLPYDQETEQKARFKSPKMSIVWLVNFGRKLVKMFGDKVIYREAEEQVKE